MNQREAEDDVFTKLVRDAFAEEDREQPGDELRCKRMATSVCAALVEEDEAFTRSTRNAFASEAEDEPSGSDEALTERMAARAQLFAADGGAPTPATLVPSRSLLRVPTMVVVLLLSSGVLAASAAVMVAVVLPKRSPVPQAVSDGSSARQGRKVARPNPLRTQTPLPETADVEPVAAPQEIPQVPAPNRLRPTLDPQPASAAHLFTQANGHRRRGDVAQAKVLYHRLLRGHPHAPEAGLARLSLADLATAKGQHDEALVQLNQFLRSLAEPGGSPALMEEALLRKARTLHAQQLHQEAATTWKELQRRFPQSVYRLEAERSLQSSPQP